jgi:patatin-related protein
LTTPAIEGQEAVEPPTLAPPPFDKLREVRFAVVMYGGVSLAIYMNGVAQELLHLVRASVPRGTEGLERDEALPESELTGSERVYRKLAQLGEDDRRQLSDIDAGDPILTQFVVDVLSGTSAGGINAIYLAKALANRQSMDELSHLWIEEGDIAKLLNDRRSARDADLPIPKPPRSLLNSQRMYLKLLDAFDGMDRLDPAGPSNESRTSPYVDELDLYVTTTDLRGLLLPIPLANEGVWERRYRNVFHFAYSTPEASGDQDPRNDFHQANNPFLAFVARCTSAFPFAFEPMVLGDIDAIVPRFPEYSERSRSDAERWWPFHRDYLPLSRTQEQASEDSSLAPLDGDGRARPPLPFRERPFGDGGALDNKPFSHATERLLRRRADLPVDRKLVFIEPDPGHPERTIEATGRPDVVQNALLQGVTLPREEAIRDDIQRIIARNEIIRRVDWMLRQVEKDIRVRRAERRKAGIELATPDFLQLDLTTAVVERGVADGGYRRLRAETVTDDVAAMMARVAGYPEDSAYTTAIRSLVSAWRDSTFADYAQLPASFVTKAEARSTLNWFLFAFDIGYRLRRLNLLKVKIDQLYRLGPEAREMLADAGIDYWPEADDRKSLQQELLEQKRVVNDVYRLLRSRTRQLRHPGSSPLRDLVEATGITRGNLEDILARRTETERSERAAELYEASREEFSALGDGLARLLVGLTREAKEEWQRRFAATDTPPNRARDAVRSFLRYTHDNFEDYDMVAFPMLYATEVGEADIVEIVRISPEDAPSIVDVRKPGRRKVIGSRYMHFGAFLDRLWRENDILWGRLDAAEILIETVVAMHRPDRQSVVNELRDEAHREIIREHIKGPEREAIISAVASALAEAPSEEADEKALRELVERTAGVPLNERLSKVLQAAVDDDRDLLEHYRKSYQVRGDLPPIAMLETISRGAHIMGRVLESAAEERHVTALKKPFAWMALLGQLLFALVEASVPTTWHHLVVRHWLVLLYVFEALALIGGLVFAVPAVQQFGLFALLVTSFLNVAVWLLGDRIRGGSKWKTTLWGAVLFAVAGVLFLAVLELVELGKQYSWIPIFGRD